MTFIKHFRFVSVSFPHFVIYCAMKGTQQRNNAQGVQND
nr:MAG TPA: hypothetical protein [Bacteriophage sp.]